VVDDDVAGLAGGLGSDDALGRDDLAGEGCLVLVDVDGDGGLVPVGIGLEEVLLSRSSLEGDGGTSSGNGGGTGSDKGLGVVSGLNNLLGGHGGRRDSSSGKSNGTDGTSGLLQDLFDPFIHTYMHHVGKRNGVRTMFDIAITRPHYLTNMQICPHQYNCVVARLL